MKYVLILSFFLVLFGQLLGQSGSPVKIRVNGVDLHYVEKGQGEALILLHGGIGDYRSWDSQIEAFAPDYRVISYSRRYHYPNQNQLTATNHSALIEADDLAALLRKIKLKKVHLVGHSYGALTALVFAIRHPQMVRTLVLAEPPVHQLIRNSPDGEAVYQEFMRVTWGPAAEAFRKGNDREAMAILAFGISGVKADDLTAGVQASPLQDPLPMKSLALSSNPFPIITNDELKRLKMPILILTGENTVKIHKLVDQELARLLHKAKEVMIPGSGHRTPRENPRVFNETVRNFLTAAKNKI